MNARVAARAPYLVTATAPHTALVLLGTGVVGGAFLKLLNTPAATGLRLVGAANSRCQTTAPAALADRRLRERLRGADANRDDGILLDALDSSACRRVIVDATASDEVAARHALWLRAGYHVVTANKAALGGSLGSWRALGNGARAGSTRYGASATVGAGLPAVATAQRLHRCGDTIVDIEGVFSGSLSWLFSRYDGSRPFSALLAEARAAGYTEPDPRADLAGVDVARKLLILARSAGYELHAADVVVENLVPPALRDVPLAEFLARSAELDAELAARLAAARAAGHVLRHLARFTADGRAEVGVRAVAVTHAAAHLTGTDNLFAFTSQRYAAQPLVIRGPGAGAEVTAQALLGDVLELAGATA